MPAPAGPPALGSLARFPKAVRMWEHVYTSARDRGYSESRSASQAWGAIRNAGYHKDAAGRWQEKTTTMAKRKTKKKATKRKTKKKAKRKTKRKATKRKTKKMAKRKTKKRASKAPAAPKKKTSINAALAAAVG